MSTSLAACAGTAPTNSSDVLTNNRSVRTRRTPQSQAPITSARENHCAGVGAAAHGVGQRGAGPGDLACLRLTSQLEHELDHLTDGRCAQWLPLRQQATAGVDRTVAAELDR